MIGFLFAADAPCISPIAMLDLESADETSLSHLSLGLLQHQSSTEPLPKMDNEPKVAIPETLQEQMQKLQEIYDFKTELNAITKERKEAGLLLNWLPFDSKKEQAIYQLWDRYPFLLAISNVGRGRCFLEEFLPVAHAHIHQNQSGIVFKAAWILQENLAQKLKITPEEADDFFGNFFYVFQTINRTICFMEDIPLAPSTQNIHTLLKRKINEILEEPLIQWSVEEVAKLATIMKIIHDADVILENKKEEISESERINFLKAFSDYNIFKDGSSQKKFITIGLAFVKKFSTPIPPSSILFPIREIIRGEIEKYAIEERGVWCKVMVHACEKAFDKVIEFVKIKYSSPAFYKYFVFHNKKELLKKFLSDGQIESLYNYVELKKIKTQ